MTTESNEPIAMNQDELYREDVYTDRKVGAIKQLTPVTASGERDAARAIIFVGETQIMLGNTPLPINFEIEATTIGEAAQQFASLAQQEAEATVKRLQEMQREMQNKIVVPGQEGAGFGGMGGMGGMGGPGGKIQLP
jgi:hypothetical protein